MLFFVIALQIIIVILLIQSCQRLSDQHREIIRGINIWKLLQISPEELEKIITNLKKIDSEFNTVMEHMDKTIREFVSENYRLLKNIETAFKECNHNIDKIIFRPLEEIRKTSEDLLIARRKLSNIASKLKSYSELLDQNVDHTLKTEENEKINEQQS